MRKSIRRRAAPHPTPLDTAAPSAITSTAAAAQATAHAAEQHTAGAYNAAITAYHAALTLEADYAPALHGLGVVCFQLGRLDDGLALIQRAVAVAPEVAEYHNNLWTPGRPRPGASPPRLRGRAPFA